MHLHHERLNRNDESQFGGTPLPILEWKWLVLVVVIVVGLVAVLLVLAMLLLMLMCSFSGMRGEVWKSILYRPSPYTLARIRGVKFDIIWPGLGGSSLIIYL